MLGRIQPLKGWGNARDVSKVWDDAKRNRATRCSNAESQQVEKVLKITDVEEALKKMLAAREGSGAPIDLDENGGDPFAPLDNLYRMQTVKDKLQQLQNRLIVAKRDGEERPKIGHFVFTGSPGTGKTTVARCVAQILHQLSLLGRNNIIETSGLELTGQYIGQTKKIVEEKLDKAKGGVLFIDEAYELGKSSFGEEAVTTLVAAMTDPKYNGLVIIIAGYEADISKMLDTNQGLKSRFNHYLPFPDWEVSDCTAHFESLASKKKLSLDNGVGSILSNAFEQLIGLNGWANARDVNGAWDGCLRERADRTAKLDANDPETKRITTDDCDKAFSEMINGRKRGADDKRDLINSLFGNPNPNRNQQQQQAPPLFQEDPVRLGSPPRMTGPQPQTEPLMSDVTPCFQQQQETQLQEDVAMDEYNDVAMEDDSSLICEEVTRDPGVTDQVWAELQQRKAYEKEHQEKLMKEEEERKEQERLAEIAYQEEQRRILQAIKEEEARQEAARKAKEAYEAKMRAIQAAREAAEKRRREAQAIQQKLQQLSPCPAGFRWTQVGGGWRCGGGSHYVSDAQLRAQFMSDV